MIPRKPILLIAILMALVCLSGCKRSTPYEKPALPVNIHLVQTSGREDGLQYSATIKPKIQMECAFRTGGYIQELLTVPDAKGRHRPVQEGDWVAKGTALAQIRQMDVLTRIQLLRSQWSEAEAFRDQAKAQVKEARAGLQQARLDFERAAALFNQQSLIKPEYDAAQARLEAGQARLQSALAQVAASQAKIKGAQAAIEEGESALKDTTLRAPMDGTILKRMVETGTLVAPGTSVFVLADTSTMKIVFGVPDLALSKIRRQMPVAVSVEALPGPEIRGKIERISPAADPSNRIFEVEILLPNPQTRLKTGMIASVLLPGSKPDKALPVVPLGAIVRSPAVPSGYAVFVVEGQAGRQKARLRPVHLGETVGNAIALTKGIQAGERVIVNGAQFLTDGLPVQVIP